MEALWKYLGSILFLCTIVTSVQMSHRHTVNWKEFHGDRTALNTRKAAVPPPNLPHNLGHPAKPLHQPWYRQVINGHYEGLPRNNRGSMKNLRKGRKQTIDTKVRSNGEREELSIPVIHHIRGAQYPGEMAETKSAALKHVIRSKVEKGRGRHGLKHKQIQKLKRRKGRRHMKHGQKLRRRGMKDLANFKMRGCLMTRACPLTVNEVCGSDGITYDNRCMLKVAACMKGRRHAIMRRHLGRCKQEEMDEEEQRPM